MPSIIRFLGHNPLQEARTLGERLVRQRTALGLSQKRAALDLGVDPGTLARWERGERAPRLDFEERIREFLAISEEPSLPISARIA